MIQINSLKCSVVELNHQCSVMFRSKIGLDTVLGSAADAPLNVIKLDNADAISNRGALR